MSEKIVLTKMELLKMARELCINEYIDKRAQDHNKWLADAEVTWKTQGVNLPYPKFPAYPTEADILTRATVLNTFLSQDSDDKKTIVEPVNLPQPVETEKTEPVRSVAAPEVTTINTTEPVTTVETPVPTVPTIELPIIPMATPTVIQPELLPANVWNNIAPTVQSQTPASVPSIPPLPEPVNIGNETTLSVIEQLKAKLGLK